MRAVPRLLLSVSLAAALLATTASPAFAAPFTPALSAADTVAREKLAIDDAAIPVGQYPFTTKPDGSWNLSSTFAWTNAFLTGSEWLAYRSTEDPAWAARAAARQVTFAPAASVTSNHDIGFVLMASYGNAFALTGDPGYRALLLEGAGSLATRYNPKVGMIRTADFANGYYVYNDTMMNIQLLFAGARNGGPAEWRQMALSHALRTGTDFLRQDGSSFHKVAYDPQTGRAWGWGQSQGYSDSSTWSRGQAWIIYGEAVAYRETGDPRCLDFARRATDYWASHVPADYVPYWDFDAPGIPDAAPRDSSAAACAASAFVMLSRLDPDPGRRAQFASLAENTLASLVSPAYLAPSGAGATTAVLLHGTHAETIHSSDTGTTWGDFYLREALAEYRTSVLRLAGPDRYATATRLSQLTFERADTVIVASGEAYPDALAASSLAGVEHAPLLLVRAGELPGGLPNEIRRLGAKRIVVVGGPSRVSASVAAALESIVGRGNLTRIAGTDRYETASLVASRVLAGRTGTRAFVARGDLFPDALSVSAVAAATGSPVLLVAPASLPPSTRGVLASGRIATATVVGSTAAVSDEVASAVASAGGSTVERVAGADRYATSAAFATWALAHGLASRDYAGVATGANYPDALAGGVVAGAHSGVLVLARGAVLGADADALLHSECTSRTAVQVFGGAPAVSEYAESQARFALHER